MFDKEMSTLLGEGFFFDRLTGVLRDRKDRFDFDPVQTLNKAIEMLDKVSYTYWRMKQLYAVTNKETSLMMEMFPMVDLTQKLDPLVKELRQFRDTELKSDVKHVLAFARECRHKTLEMTSARMPRE